MDTRVGALLMDHGTRRRVRPPRAPFRWVFGLTIRFDVGYRILAEDYDSSGFLYGMRTEGPYLGVRIVF